MKDPSTIIEYGVPIDPRVMIEPPRRRMNGSASRARAASE
jgi:hypothetical protein